jgi:hypothetical protein
MIDSLETSSNRHFKLKWKRNELRRLKMNRAVLKEQRSGSLEQKSASFKPSASNAALVWVGDNLQTMTEHLKKAWISV